MSQDVMVVDTGITAALLSGFLGFHGNVVEDAVFLGRCATLLGNCSPTFETTTLSRNVGRQSPNDAAPHPRRICDHNSSSFTRPGNWG